MFNALAGFGNIFAFKGSFQAEINVGENEPGESAIRRFRKAVMSSGHIVETRRRRYHENKQDILKRKQSTPRKKKGGKPRTYAQMLAEKEQQATQGARGNFNRGPRMDSRTNAGSGGQGGGER